jgi:ABC-type glycerol-3-phosphate transport system permease component
MIRRAAIHLVLILLALTAMLPFLWVLCAAFKTPADLAGNTLLPWGHLNNLTLDNFRRLGEFPLWHWEINSIFLASVHTVLVVTLGSLGGFALAKYQFVGKTLLSAIMLATLLLPPQVFLPGSYDLMYRFGWLDSYLAIVVPGAVSVFGIFLFRQAMRGVPDDLVHSARIDGCSEVRIWWEIALPMVRPMIGAYTLMAFLAEWNSFLWPQVVLQSEAKYTLTMGLNSLLGLPEYQFSYGIVMAATLIAVAPVAILFFALQGEFVSGLVEGAGK